MKIGMVARFQNGYAFKSKDFSIKGNYRIVKIKELKDGKIKFYDDSKFISINDISRYEKYLVNKNDILFALTGDPVNRNNPLSWVGRVSIYQHDIPALINQRVCKLIPGDNINAKYIYYYFRDFKNLYALASIAKGSASQANISTKDIENFDVVLPSLENQNKVIAILDSIEKKINNNISINNNLEQQAMAIFKNWLIDYEPFVNHISTRWEPGTIKDLSKEIICGKTPSTKKAEYYGSDVPFITIPDMHNKVFSIKTARYLSAEGASSQIKKMLPNNTICVSCIGTAGLVTITSENSQTNQQINSIIPKDKISPYYIYLLMKTLSNKINKLGQSGSTIVNLNKEQFSKIKINIPDDISMNRFHKIISPLFNSILNNQKENLYLSDLKNTILPRLLSGELDISNIEI